MRLKSRLRTTAGRLSVLIGMMSILSPAVFARTNPGTERLDAQMQCGRGGGLIPPKNALSVAGLATPYQLTADPRHGSVQRVEQRSVPSCRPGLAITAAKARLLVARLLVTRQATSHTRRQIVR